VEVLSFPGLADQGLEDQKFTKIVVSSFTGSSDLWNSESGVDLFGACSGGLNAPWQCTQDAEKDHLLFLLIKYYVVSKVSELLYVIGSPNTFNPTQLNLQGFPSN
jgi:hypothetical protein